MFGLSFPSRPGEKLVKVVLPDLISTHKGKSFVQRQKALVRSLDPFRICQNLCLLPLTPSALRPQTYDSIWTQYGIHIPVAASPVRFFLTCPYADLVFTFHCL